MKDKWKESFKQAAHNYTGQSQFRRHVKEPTRKFVKVFKKLYEQTCTWLCAS